MTDVLRQEIATLANLIVVKVGSQVLTGDDGRLDYDRIAQLAGQLHEVLRSGRRVVLVSSGAVSAGMGRLGLAQRPTDLPHLQAVAAIGQSILVEAYERALAPYGHHAAQVLLTAEDLEHRLRYLNARNTLLTLLELGAIPIINENDTVAVEELRTTFGDNDRLAAIVTNLLRAQLLILLSDVEGLCDGNPREPGAKIIPTVERLDRGVYDLVCDKTGGRGKGGMASKLEAARLCVSAGENVIIACGRDPQALPKILAGESVGTLFLTQGQSLAARKRWIGFSVKPRGILLLDAGATEAVLRKGRSLLAAGIIQVEGDFSRGDVVEVRGPDGSEVARGLTNYDFADLAKIKGLRTAQIAEALGDCPYAEVVHRDNMVITAGA